MKARLKVKLPNNTLRALWTFFGITVRGHFESTVRGNPLVALTGYESVAKHVQDLCDCVLEAFHLSIKIDCWMSHCDWRYNIYTYIYLFITKVSAPLQFRISACAAMSEWWQIFQKCEWQVFDGKLWRVTTYTSGWKDWMHGFIFWMKVLCCFFQDVFLYMFVNEKKSSALHPHGTNFQDNS